MQRFLLSALFPKVMKAKVDSLALLKESKINWTVVRCPYIVDNECEEYEASLDKCKGKNVSKLSLLNFILTELEREQYLFKAPFVYN